MSLISRIGFTVGLSPSSRQCLIRHLRDYADLLVYQARIIAKQNRSRITPDYLDQARELVASGFRRQTQRAFWYTLIGGGLLSAFLQGFPQEFYGANRWEVNAMWALFGFVGFLFAKRSLRV